MARPGMSRPGRAWRGAAWQGWARRGEAWPGGARRGKGANGPFPSTTLHGFKAMGLQFNNRLFVEDQLQALAARSAQLKDGEILPYEEIEALTEFKRNSPEWRKLVGDWKKKA